eukprot:symbB.v1.2.026402.t1/scaffold2632.1/size74410/3
MQTFSAQGPMFMTYGQAQVSKGTSQVTTLLDVAARLKATGDWRGAAEKYFEVLSLEPENLSSHQNLGTLYLAAGDFAKALEHSEKAYKLDPRCTEAMSNIGAVCRQQGNFQVAADWYRAVLRLSPNCETTPLHLAVSLINHGLQLKAYGGHRSGWNNKLVQKKGTISRAPHMRSLNRILPQKMEKMSLQSTHGAKTMRIVCQDGSPIQQGDIADPMTWQMEDHESTEGSLQFLTASEVPSCGAKYLGHRLYHLQLEDLNGHLPDGVCPDSQGNLYLAEEALPLVLFKLDSERLLKILLAPRSVNEAEAGRNLDMIPLSATEIM